MKVCSSQRQKSDEAMVSNSAAFSLPVSTSAKVGIAILTLAFALGFPGNLFVAWSVVCRVRKRSVTCLLVLNLAVADASVLLTAPVFLRFLAGGRGWEFGSPACKLVHYLSSVNMYVSIYLICLMSMDRWLAVTRPFLSQRMRTKRSLLILLLGVWSTAFLLSLPMPFYRSNLRKVLPNNATLRFCVPYHWQSSAAFKRRGQGSRLILMIICTFALFWLPYHIVNTIEVIGLLQGSRTTVAAALAARPNVTAFAYFSSAVNPILYVFAGSSHIRQAGLGFMGKLFEATNSESRSASTFIRGGRTGSSREDCSVLQTLSVKPAKPFRGRQGDAGDAETRETDEPEPKTLASVEPLE
ncbi:leukotriene B4 receptor 1-like isoform X5 [Phycodurus eques]|uniref:leukotriene B4 receptor 1-like isoform X5 n=1 Tax=Phycodurus eques TaxID=693459 RepID=UPI002ACEAF49|nr:leukotriene B4 receptor 1-like isoform X5 [Phycodurus eques]